MTTVPAPVGMDSSSDPAVLSADKGQVLQNLLPGWSGLVRGSLSRRRLLPAAASATIDGLAYYYDRDPERNRLLWVTGGSLFGAKLVPGHPVPSLTNIGMIGGGFTPGVRVRHAAFEGETIFVQADAGIKAKRYDGVGLYQLGIDPPPPPVITFAPPTSPPVVKRSLIHYRFTYLDSKMRESSLGEPTDVTYTVNASDPAPTSTAYIHAPDFADPQARYARLYCTAVASDFYFNIATFTKDPLTGSITPSVFEDNVPDNIVTQSAQWPDPDSFSLNNVPNNASCICVHKNYVMMNDSTDAASIQISNIDSPTQWADFSTLPTAGGQFRMIQDIQDSVVQLVTFGSILAILKKHTGMYALLGDTVQDFETRAIQSRPAIAPDAFTRCDNELWYVSDDGIYSVDFTGTFLIHKVSKDIEPYFLNKSKEADGRALLEAAVACYTERAYNLGVGRDMFRFDFDVGGWYQVAL